MLWLRLFLALIVWLALHLDVVAIACSVFIAHQLWLWDREDARRRQDG